MNKRIFKYLLLVFAAIAVKVKGESKSQHQSSISQRIFRPSASSGYENSRIPHVYFLGTYGSAQICRSQTHRSSSFFKSFFTSLNKHSAYFQFLSNTFRQTRDGFAQPCKLILFPFHAFW
jgi:hypothetical protein